MSRPTRVLAVALFLAAVPLAGHAQMYHSFTLGAGGSTWTGMDFLDAGSGVNVDAQAMFGVGRDFQVGVVGTYGNYDLGGGPRRVSELSGAIQGRFVSRHDRWGIDPYVGARLGFGKLTGQPEDVEYKSSGFTGGLHAGFYYPLANSDHMGDLSIGMDYLGVDDFEGAGSTVQDSSDSGWRFYVRVGLSIRMDR